MTDDTVKGTINLENFLFVNIFKDWVSDFVDIVFLFPK